MSSRSTQVLAVIALALAGFIFVYEQHSLSTGELEGRAGRLLERFVRDRVERIEIDRGEDRIVLSRVRDEPGELGEWRLLEPLQAAADEEIVAGLLGSLEWADPRRSLRGVSDADLAEFGLDAPHARARIHVANEVIELSLGAESPNDDGLYVRLGEERVVHIVGRDLDEALDHGAGHYRSKQLFELFSSDRLRGLELHAEIGERVLRREGSRYWLEGEARILASEGRVESLVSALAELRIQRFIDEADVVTGLERASLRIVGDFAPPEPPAAEAPESEAAAPQLPSRFELRVGAACGEHAEERYARLDDGPLVCVLRSDLEPFEVSAEELRDLRLASAESFEIEGIEIDFEGELLAIRDVEGEGWRFTEGEGEDALMGEVDAEILGDWLRELRRSRADEVLVADEATLEAVGLGTPRGQVRLLPRGDRGGESIAIGAFSLEGLFIRRGDEPVVLRFPPSVEALLRLERFELRPKALLHEREAALARIEVQREGVREVVEREDGSWRLRAPIEAPASSSAAQALARRLSELSAIRFVAASASEEHQLHPGSLTLRVRFEGALADDSLGPDEGHDHDHDHEEGDEAEPDADSAPAPREVQLRFGARVEEGVYAQLGDDEAVMLLPAALLELLLEPLVAPSLLATEGDHVERLEFERGEERISLRHEGIRFVTDAGPADMDATRELLAALGELRIEASGGYGPALAADGLEPPRLRLVLTRAEGAGEPRVLALRIGAQVGEGEQARVHVRREDLEIGFLVRPEGLAPLLEYQP